MPWSEVAPGKFQRTIGENEHFIKLVGDPGHSLGHEHWAINAVATFALKGSFVHHNIPSLFLEAWKHMRFRHPSIAAYAIDDRTLEYTIPNITALSQWAAETFKIVEDKTAHNLIPHLKPNKYATLTYLVSTSEILCHTAHWRTDGVGVLLLLDSFFESFATLNLPEATGLAWGQEIVRLAPAVEDAASMPRESTDAIKILAQECVETFHQASGAIGIPYRGEDATLPSGTGSSRLAFTPTETRSVVIQCKDKGLSVTSTVHASIAAANRTLASEKDEGKHYTSTIRFSLRPYLPEPYNSSAFASGLYTTGWMKKIPASASWLQHAQAYNEEYRKGLSKEYLNSHREYAIGLGNLIRNMPQGGDTPSDVDISSIGVAEHLIARTKGTSDRAINIQDVCVGVETLTRQCVCFVWTFRDQLNLNLVYNQSFHDELDTTKFLHIIKKTMLDELTAQE